LDIICDNDYIFFIGELFRIGADLPAGANLQLMLRRKLEGVHATRRSMQPLRFFPRPIESVDSCILAMSGEMPYIMRRRGSLMVAAQPRNSRIEARIAPDTLAAVRRAAEIQGRSVSDFVVDAARRAAEETIRETQMIRLTLADQEKVAEILSQPPAHSDALERARKARDELIG
jgi:uncharacterized protein (DUF1778 family)